MDKLLDEQLVLRDRIEVSEVRGAELEAVMLHGRLECAHGLLLSVRKRLDVRRGLNNRYEGKTLDYSYHSWIRRPRQHVARYDNAHDSLPIHCHRFDLATGEESHVEYYHDMSEFPTLDLVIREAVELAVVPT